MAHSLDSSQFYMNKNKEKEAIKAKERAEKDKLKNVLITETAETSVRKEQHEREKGWKSTQKETLTSLKDVVITDTAETDIR